MGHGGMCISTNKNPLLRFGAGVGEWGGMFRTEANHLLLWEPGKTRTRKRRHGRGSRGHGEVRNGWSVKWEKRGRRGSERTVNETRSE